MNYNTSTKSQKRTFQTELHRRKFGAGLQSYFIFYLIDALSRTQEILHLQGGGHHYGRRKPGIPRGETHDHPQVAWRPVLS